MQPVARRITSLRYIRVMAHSLLISALFLATGVKRSATTIIAKAAVVRTLFSIDNHHHLTYLNGRNVYESNNERCPVEDVSF